jgi:hypothetical protein
MTGYDKLLVWVAVVLSYGFVSENEPGGSASDKAGRKQISVRLNMTVYEGVFSSFKREYGFTDLSAAEILILYALPRRYEAIEEFTRERRRAAESEGGAIIEGGDGDLGGL